jgi:hypothetical protein
MSSTFAQGPTPTTVRAADGKVGTIPEGWTLVPLGDAARSRRIEAADDPYPVAEKKGRKVFSRGKRVAAATVDHLRADFEAKRSITLARDEVKDRLEET